jgi:hypothetical protein
MDIEDVIPAVNCKIKMERNGNKFKVSVVGDDGKVFQNFNEYELYDGDVLQINGLGFKVTFNGTEWNPLYPKRKGAPSTSTIQLKRKMDIPNGH